MIKVEANKGNVHVIEAHGDGFTLMSEICYIVKALCTVYCREEELSKEMRKEMILTIAQALTVAEKID